MNFEKHWQNGFKQKWWHMCYLPRWQLYSQGKSSRQTRSQASCWGLGETTRVLGRREILSKALTIFDLHTKKKSVLLLWGVDSNWLRTKGHFSLILKKIKIEMSENRVLQSCTQLLSFFFKFLQIWKRSKSNFYQWNE